MLAMDEAWPQEPPQRGDITAGNGLCHPARCLHYQRRVVHDGLFRGVLA